MKRRITFFISVISIITLTILFVSKKDYREILLIENSVREAKLNEKIIPRINDNIEHIKEQAQFNSISENAAIGIILAEHSFHNSPANYFEEYYVKNFFLDKNEEYLESLMITTRNGLAHKRMKGESEKEFLWRMKNGLIWSIGICQISIMKAYDNELIFSKNEDIKPKSIKEIITNLLDDKININHCYRELAYIRDKLMQETGYDISNKPEILATLYNTGKIDETIQRIKKSGEKYSLQPNSFGKFIQNNIEIINKIKTAANIKG